MKERFVFIPPTDTALWGVTVLCSDGSYRQPTFGELVAMRTAWEDAESERERALEETERALEETR